MKETAKKSVNAIKALAKQLDSNENDTFKISEQIYQLFSDGVYGKIPNDLVVSSIGEISKLHPEIPSIILDVACILDSETSGERITEERNNFCTILRDSEKFLSEKLLKERLDIDTLQDIGTLKNKNFYTKFIKIKTKLYYKQRKFNLFREESEGYAKLIVELNQDFNDKVDFRNISEIIKSLIGCFNLDPNRVLDIILESFEARPESENLFIPLIKSYMNDANIICEILGFKFSKSSEEAIPQGLYTITALLLQHNIITLDDIFSWLSPDNSIMVQECEKEMKEAQEYARKLAIICTNKQPEETEQQQQQQKDVPQEKEIDLTNQKLNLGAALLEVGCWTVFNSLASRLPDYLASSYPPATKAMCRMLHSIIDIVYREHCPLAPKIKYKPVKPLSSTLAVPQIQKIEEISEVVVPALACLGPALHTDPVLMYKIVRLCRAARQTKGDLLRLEIMSILDSSILPALSYMDCNCCMAEEIFTVIKLYPYQFRYCLYARWKNEAPLRHAALIRRRADAQRQIKAIMKRVSKENVKPQGRLIGKLSHAAPGFFFDYVLLQIQIYDNLIGPVVESLKYLTSLSYDMLGYCLVEALGGGRRARVQPDGSSAAPWLQGLASFCGAACKKYAIDLTALLQFVANQLKAEKSLDLLILKEIVQKMAGIEAAEEMTTDQLDAMAGGELLRGEAGYFSQVRNTKKSSQRLKEALINGGNGLDAALCLLAAQQRYCCVFKTTGAEGAQRPHLKLVGRLVDQCQDTLVQFGAFLAATHTSDEYTTRIPAVQVMLQEYQIGADVAFFLARPAITHSITARYEKLRRESSDGRKAPASIKAQRYAEASAKALSPIVSAVSSTLPPKVWEDISPEFYVTFWSLTMYDLHVPVESYEREIERLRGLAAAIASDGSNTASKGRKEQERYNTLIDKLQEERRKQQEHVDKVMHRLRQEKDGWFLSRSAKLAKNETITQFMQLCLFPRCIFTATDAIYCAHFLHTIHLLKTANFSTLLCYDRLFCDITYTVTCLTEGEATRYGQFLRAVLSTAMKWHSDKATFQKECSNYPGFVTKYRVSNQFLEANDHVGFENYRHVCHKWHYKITKAMVVCLDSRDYVQIRNSLIILIRILPHFPVLAKLSQIIERKIEKVKEEEKNKRQDLYILATSYSGQLRMKASQMMWEEEFHQVSKPNPKPQSTPQTTVNGEQKSEKEVKKESSGTVNNNSSSSSNRDKKSDWDNRTVIKSVNREDEPRRKDKTPNERSYTNYPTDDQKYILCPVSPVQNPAAEEMSSLSSTNSNGSHRNVPEISDRDVKRRKLEDNVAMKSGKERESSPTEKRLRSSSKNAVGGSGSSVSRNSSSRVLEDREARKERKLGRKRDRSDEVILEQKRRRDDLKGHQNGEQDDHHLEKHHHKREKSPYRDRSHERQEIRDKQRSDERKLRR